MKINVIRDRLLKRVKSKQERKDQIVIVNSALDVIKEESKKWKFLEKECGGSLIGAYEEDKCFILYAIRTGYFAHQDFGGISTDVNYQNKIFDILLDKYPKADLIYLGDYHLHPMFLPTLSGTDERTCYEILSDQKHQKLPKLAIILTTYCNGQQEIYSYLVSRSKTISQAVKPVSIIETKLDTVMPEDSSVKKLLSQEYVDIDVLTKETAFHGAETEETNLFSAFYEIPFYKIPAAKERFIEEVDKIQDQFQIDLTPTYIENGIISLEFKIKEVDIYIFFPREYPLNPPTIFFGVNEGELSEFSSKKNWNSMSSSIDLLEELLEGGKFYED